MGVPKFYQWVSERYPLINQQASQPPFPVFDNLYLDMNGIIHNCARTDKGAEPLADREVFSRIFNYIDSIVQLVRPQNLAFFAIDGVAPRSKMNQQRQRRFKVARERDAKAEGEDADATPAFDSNSITPGTLFMTELSNQLCYFIQQKIQTDSIWQKFTVIFSGSSEPGEGEHKIAAYIRQTHNPAKQLRHCMYGLDADLIMLGLATHEKFFTLLREKVVLRRGGDWQLEDRKATVSSQEFHFLHLNLLREYLDMEFRPTAPPAGGQLAYNFSRVIDDFIFMCFFVGNDFLPPLPTFDIDEGGLNAVFAFYKKLFPTWTDYLVNAHEGTINLAALSTLFAEMGDRERQALEKQEKPQQAEDAAQNAAPATPASSAAPSSSAPSVPPTNKWKTPAASKSGTEEAASSSSSSDGSSEKTARSPDDDDDTDYTHHDTSEEDNARAASALKSFLGVGSSAGSSSSSSAAAERPPAPAATTESEPRAMGLKTATVAFQAKEAPEWKKRFYVKKMEGKDKGSDEAKATEDEGEGEGQESLALFDQEVVNQMCRNYLEGLYWVLQYYYHGPPSWRWFYGHHFAPLSVDVSLHRFFPVNFNFSSDVGAPFTPFQQLLGVLPPSSADLLPAALRPLMLDSASPIASFYPPSYRFIPDHRGRSWKDIAMIPFVDEDKLVDAIKKINLDGLSSAEKARNAFGPSLKFSHSASSLAGTPGYQAFGSQHFEGLPSHTAPVNVKVEPAPTVKIFTLRDPAVLSGEAKKGERQFPVPPPYGFPTFHTLPFVSELRKNEVNVFGAPSRYENLIVRLTAGYHNANNPAASKSADPTLLKKMAQDEDGFARQIIGTQASVGWPYHREGIIAQVATKAGVYSIDAPGAAPTFTNYAQGETFELLVTKKSEQEHLRYRGLDISGQFTKALVRVRSLCGVARKISANGFSVSVSRKECPFLDGPWFPFEACLLLPHHVSALRNPRYKDAPDANDITTEFPVGSTHVALHPDHAGSIVHVRSYHLESRSVNLFVARYRDPLFPPKSDSEAFDGAVVQRMLDRRRDNYVSLYTAAGQLKLPGLVLNRLCGSLTFQPGDYDFGLGMKYTSRELQVEGYCRRVRGAGSGQGVMDKNKMTWELSSKAIDLIRRYIVTFPEVVDVVRDDPHKDNYRVDALIAKITASSPAPAPAPVVQQAPSRKGKGKESSSLFATSSSPTAPTPAQSSPSSSSDSVPTPASSTPTDTETPNPEASSASSSSSSSAPAPISSAMQSRLQTIAAWVDEYGLHKHTLVPCDSSFLPASMVTELANETDRTSASKSYSFQPEAEATDASKGEGEGEGEGKRTGKKKGYPQSLSLGAGFLLDPHNFVRGVATEWANRPALIVPAVRSFAIGDRVINVVDSGSVPFGMTGWVVGMLASSANATYETPSSSFVGEERMLEVMWDAEFMCGHTLNGRLAGLGLRGTVVPATSLLNFTKPTAFPLATAASLASAASSSSSSSAPAAPGKGKKQAQSPAQAPSASPAKKAPAAAPGKKAAPAKRANAFALLEDDN
eukprot:TRINITY_DN2672_c0_g1_i1.p1 TRINITY_DN2672_c0_g1~~TRINITY_DN2672_c0_g1_i1.p1  ORF type:complete len:1529 (-),score=543.78 TRINITY_DN2672_c0_g1_i1:58-4644(-)